MSRRNRTGLVSGPDIVGDPKGLKRDCEALEKRRFDNFTLDEINRLCSQ